jgi:hypothetical protein
MRRTHPRIIPAPLKKIIHQFHYYHIQRWFRELSDKKLAYKAQIGNLSFDEDNVTTLVNTELDRLSDMKSLYTEADITEKQQLVRLVFDCSLYYQDGTY